MCVCGVIYLHVSVGVHMCGEKPETDVSWLLTNVHLETGSLTEPKVKKIDEACCLVNSGNPSVSIILPNALSRRSYVLSFVTWVLRSE